MRRRQRHRERARTAVDAEPFQADGPAGHAARGFIERTAQRCDGIGARAPVAADRNLDLHLAFLDVERLRRQQAVADDVDRQLAGVARIHGDGHRLAGEIVRLVDGGLEQIGRVGAAVRIPADIEGDGCQRTIGLGALDVEAIAAGRRRGLYARRLAGDNGEIAVGDALVDLTGS